MVRQYMPKSMRQVSNDTHKPAYCVGFKSEAGSYGFSHGPFDLEEDVLEVVGSHGESIWYLDPKGKVTELWKWKDSVWVEVENESDDNMLCSETLDGVQRCIDLALGEGLLAEVVFHALKEMQLNVALTPLGALNSGLVEWDIV